MSQQHQNQLIVAAMVCVAAVVGYVMLRDVLSLEYLATKEKALRDYYQQNPFSAYAFAFVLYIAVTGLSIPGATVLSLFYGWFFGLVRGVLIVSFASTMGATVAFLLSRYLVRDVIQNRFGERLKQFNHALDREGAFYLFTLRLIPAVPFFVINVVMGLTQIRTLTYWWVSQLGMFPATVVYLYAGASVPTLTELADQGTSGILNTHIMLALLLLGLFPFLVRYLLSKFAVGSSARSEIVR